MVRPAGADAPPGPPVPGASGLVNVREKGATCDLSADDGAAFLAALTEGRGVLIPHGCRLLVGTPGAGRTKFALPSGTRVVCADHSAGFFLARRVCTTGDYVGAACTSTADCAGGTCGYDGGLSSEFAPGPPTNVYTLFGAAAVCGGGINIGRRCTQDADCPSAAPNVPPFPCAGQPRTIEIRGCTIWANQADDYQHCGGGAKADRPCAQVCDPNDPRVAAALRGKACPAGDAGCGGIAGSCLNTAQCGDGGGTCDGRPGSPAGAGRVNFIDFGTAIFARVVDVTFSGATSSEFLVRIGKNSRIVDVEQTDDLVHTQVPYPFGLPTGPGLAIDRGYWVVDGGNTIRGNRVTATGIGVLLGGSNHVTGNDFSLSEQVERTCAGGRKQYATCAVDSDCPGSTCTGPYNYPTAVYLAGDQNKIVDNQFNRVWNGIRGDGQAGLLSGLPRHGGNVVIVANRFVLGRGPKIIVTGAGYTVASNYVAWGSGGQTLCGGTCANRWTPCAADDECTGCAAGADRCARPPAILIGSDAPIGGGAAHPGVTGNLIHTEQPDTALLAFAAPGFRCIGGANAGRPCTVATEGSDCPDSACHASAQKTCIAGPRKGLLCRTDGPADCPGAPCPGCCLSPGGPRGVTDVHVAGNELLGSAATTAAVDFSRPLVSGATGVDGVTIHGNRVAVVGGIGFRFAPSARTPPALSDLAIYGNDVTSVATKLVHWDGRYGVQEGQIGLDPTADDPKVVRFAVKGSIAQYSAVQVDLADGHVVVADAAANRPIGCVLDAPAAGALGRVAVGGTATCACDASLGPVVSGARLAIGRTAGVVSGATGSGAMALGFALGPCTDGRVRALIQPHAILSASEFPGVAKLGASPR